MANKKKKKNSNKTVAAKKVSKTKKKMSPEAKEKLKDIMEQIDDISWSTTMPASVLAANTMVGDGTLWP